MIFPCWLCREILKIFLVVLLRVVFRLYEGIGVGVDKYFDILESHGQLVVRDGYGRGGYGPFSRELVKHPLVVGVVFLVSFHRGW